MVGCRAMLERAALHQSRFRTPGVSPDARGVVLGQKGLLLFPTVDRAVAFLRAYSEAGSLDELVPSLILHRVVTPLRTREVVILLDAESSYRMDRVAGFAKLAGGLVFTGTQRHFVKYRDAAAPLGYDVQELAEARADFVLYHDAFDQTYTLERELPLQELVVKLQLERAPGATAPAGMLHATAEPGIGRALVRYLFRWHVDASCALVEWPAASAFDAAPRRAYLFELRDVPARIVRLLRGLPGVHLFVPVAPRAAVELGYRHPIALDSCATLFPEHSLYLFRAGAPVDVVAPLPAFARVDALVHTELSLSAAEPPHVTPVPGEPLETLLSLQLRPTSEPWRDVRATVVPREQRAWLARMLYVLPPRTLASLRIAIADDRVFLVDPGGIEGVPLGTFYRELAPRVLVPAGMTLWPSVPSDVLLDLVGQRGRSWVFFEPDHSAPTVLAEESFGPVARRAIRSIAGLPVSADAPESDEPKLPSLEYGGTAFLPLWGAPGKDEA